MGAINHPATLPAPPVAISRVLSRFTREELEGFVAIAIDLMDMADGDPDAEIGNDAEDDFQLSPMALDYVADVPGCPITEPDAVGYLEWDSRGRHKLSSAGGERLARDAYGNIAYEDDEDSDPAEEDDPSGQCDEDGVNTSFDGIRYTAGASGPGCSISDPGGGNVENEGQINEVPAYSEPLPTSRPAGEG